MEARIRALVAAWALTGNAALLPDGKLNPDLQLLIRNIVTGGWRADAAITVSQRIQGPAFTLATARTQTYRTEYDPPGPRQTNVNIAVRIARPLFDTIPTAADSSKVRVRLDSNAAVAPTLSTGTHLGSGPTDADDSFDYYNLPIPDLPADSIANPELDAPTELTNISIPAESIVGRLPGASAGVRTLLDGNITGLSVQALNALKNGNATPFSPTFSIAADGSNANGIFEVSIRTSIGTSSDTLSFDNDETTNTRTVSGIVTASDLRAQAVFTRAGAVEGIRAARVPVYAVSGAVYTEVGHLNLYLVRDASNEVSYLFDYRPNGVHTETGNAAFGAHLVVAFQRQDQGSGGGGSGTITATATLPDLILFGVAANSKTVTLDTGKVVHSDWEKVNLTANATPQEGITINAASEIVFATAKKVNFHGEFDYTGDGGAGGSRIYTRFRLSKVGTPNTVVRQSKDSGYEKSTPSGAAELSQGPITHSTAMAFPLDAAAGDRYIVEWEGYFQSNTTVTMDHANSEIDIRILEPTITITQS